MSKGDLVRKLWAGFDAGDFDGVSPLLHEDFVAEWPQSRERMRGRANFLAVNRNYPGVSRCSVRRIVEAGDVVVSEVEIVNDGKPPIFAVSFFEVREGRLARAVEYWGEPYEAPAWRSQWVEKLS